MPEYDMIIRNGTIVDGTGGLPAYRADLAVKDGKIAMISGRIQASAKKELDATGCIVAPGAIDLHSHYDLQLNWEPYGTMSGWHGVTSVTIGQCGFGFAPCKPEDREAAMRLMTRIESVPLKTMELGLRWDWETFPQWLDSLDSHPLGINVGALVPHNPLRLFVIGPEEARERVQATDDEIKQMQGIQYEAMEAGAFGWSAMKTLINRPDDGRFIPSQVASNDEFLAPGGGHVRVRCGQHRLDPGRGRAAPSSGRAGHDRWSPWLGFGNRNTHRRRGGGCPGHGPGGLPDTDVQDGGTAPPVGCDNLQ